MPAAVGTPSVLQRSLTAIGTPCSGPRERPAAVSASRAAASASARSGVRVAIALEPGIEPADAVEQRAGGIDGA